jgi:hypothetical protein
LVSGAQMEMAVESDGGRWCGGADEVVVVGGVAFANVRREGD